MRPNSIVYFERIFLISILLTAIGAFLSFDQTLAQMQANADFNRLGWGASVLVATAVSYVILLLLLDYFIAHRASKIAKWILVLLTVMSFTTLPGAFAVQSGLPLIIAVLTNLLAIAAIVLLFTPSARKWLNSAPSGGPEPANSDAE